MTNGASAALETRVQSIRRRWHGKVVYEMNHDDRTVQFFDSEAMPLVRAEEVCVGLRADLDLHKPKPAPVAHTGPELAPDFLQKNMNRLLEMPAGLVVRPAPRWLRWLGFHSVIARE